MGRNLFRAPFDDGTIDKLNLFEDYFKEWLPVFLAREKPIWNEIQIFDMFGGEGKDLNGVYGSPMRILSVLNENSDLIKRSGVKIRVIINELEKEKYSALVANLKSIADDSLYELKYFNDEFSHLFSDFYESMKKTANFLFLDQNGIKQITEKVFIQLIELRQTDFLFFISSSYIKRFSELDEFKKYLNITKQDFVDKSYYHIHRIVLNYYRSIIPLGKKYYLAPFSIKKPSGIYGLIFGSNHIYGLEKFLSVSWKYDKLTGEANFDIDNEKINLNTPTLFEQYNVPTKRQLFERDLREKILKKELASNFDIYLYGLEEGFLPKNCNKVLAELKMSGVVDFKFNLQSGRIHKITQPEEIKIL